MPQLWRSQHGPIAWASTTGIGMAVAWADKIVGLTTSAVPHRFEDGTWTIGTQLTGQTGNNTASAIFVDSRGYVFLSVIAGGGVWRSIDDGQSFTKVIAFPFTDEHTTSFTEDDLGNLYTHSYGHATKSVALYKSSDGGANWTEISDAPVTSADQTGGTVQSLVNRHIHTVYFCPHRKWLFVTHGDAGSKSPVLVSDDYGASFTAWGRFDTANNVSATRQVTGITSDAQYIYLASDVGASVNDAADDMNLYRVAHNAASGTLAGLVASAPVLAFDIHDYLGLTTGAGFCWWGYVNEYGVVVFTHASAAGHGLLMASEDQGATFEVLDEATTGSTKTWAWEFALPSLYLETRSPYLYHRTSDSAQPFAWRVLPSDYTVLGDAEFGRHAAETQVFASDVETNPALTTSVGGSNTVTQDSTDRAVSGTKSVKLACVGGAWCQARKDATLNGSFAEGNEVAIESSIYVEAASLTANLQLHAFHGTGTIEVGFAATNRLLRVVLGGNGGAAKRVLDTGYVLPLNEWVRLRSVLKLHRSQGELSVLADGELVFRIVGIVSASGTGTATLLNARWAADTSQTLNVYHDDLYVGRTLVADVPERWTPGEATAPEVIPAGLWRGSLWRDSPWRGSVWRSAG